MVKNEMITAACVTNGRDVLIDIDDIILPSKLKRSMNPEKVQMLANSMGVVGLRHAITITDNMVLIAGNHRLAAARSLGWKQIKTEVVPKDEILNELVSIDENLLRHDLTVLEQGEHLKRRNQLLISLNQRALSGNPGEVRNVVTVKGKKGAQSRAVGTVKVNTKTTTNDIAHDMGMAARTVQERMQIANDIDDSVRESIRNLPIADNKAELIRLAKLTPQEQRDVISKLAGGLIKTIKEGATSVIREKQRVEFNNLSEETKRLPDTVVLVNKDFFDYEDSIPDNSIDLILTDPPYISEWKDNISPFMTVANRILKPGGVMVMVIGHVRLPEVFAGFADCAKLFKDTPLQFYHMCALAHEGHLAAMHHVGAMNGYKPIVIAMKAPLHKPIKMYNDLIKGSGREKDIHEWQQSAEEVLPLVDAFSKPGDTILDPFMGTGTYGIVAKMTVRKFIGIEMDTNTFQDAHRHILEVEK